jgi:hypothetical protein
LKENGDDDDDDGGRDRESVTATPTRSFRKIPIKRKMTEEIKRLQTRRD